MSKMTLTIQRTESCCVRFLDWFPMVRGDFKTEQHAINHWEAMCRENGEEWNDDSHLDIEDCEDILAEIADEVEVEDECESCGFVSEDNIVHSFGCVELCEKCSKEGHEPHCPKKHADHECDPCDWCEEQWAVKEKQLAEAALLEASLATPAPPPPLVFQTNNATPAPPPDAFAAYPPLTGTLEERLAAAYKDVADENERVEVEVERDEIAMLMRMVREKAKKIGMKLKIEEE